LTLEAAAFISDRRRALAAFDQIWERVVLEHPNREPSRDDEVRTELAREIVAYASTGISDPDELGKWALKSLRHVGLLR
jgi:hypothetical protein